MLAALAWVCADAILLVRTGNQRYAVTGVLVYFGGLLFFEKAAVIPFVAFAVAALLCHVQGDRVGVAHGVAGRSAVVDRVAGADRGWVAVYLAVVNQQRWSFDLAMTWDLLWRSITHGIVPGLAGGPWHWDRWAPASPWATPPPSVMALGWLVLAAVLAVSLVRKQRIGPVWLTAAGYAVACQVPIYLMRSSKLTALELAQTLRYLPDLVVVLALLAAVALCAPNRPAAPRWLDAVAETHRRDRGFGGGVRGQQPVLDGDVSDQLAGQPGTALSAERPGRFGGRARGLGCAAAGSGGRSAGAATGGRAGEPGQPHVRAAARQTGIRHGDNTIAHAGQLRPAGRRARDLGPHHRAGTDAAVRLFRAAG